MAVTESGYSRNNTGSVLRSSSSAGKSNLSSRSLSCATGFASSSSGFASRSSTFFGNYQTAPPQQSHHHHERSASPTRVNFRSLSPGRSIAAVGSRSGGQVVRRPKRTCMCSPTNHPGSFRCSLHKGNAAGSGRSGGGYTSVTNYHRLHARRSAMTNSLVRIGGVEGGDLVKRALSALIRPSSHHQRRRGDFQPRPSRLSVMSMT